MSDTKQKELDSLESEMVSGQARMDTKFGTLLVKLLMEKDLDSNNIAGWYRLTEFKPEENDDLYEHWRSWDYLMRLVPITLVGDDKRDTVTIDDSIEIILMRRSKRSQRGFELPREGLLHITQVHNQNVDVKFPSDSSMTRAAQLSNTSSVGIHISSFTAPVHQSSISARSQRKSSRSFENDSVDWSDTSMKPGLTDPSSVSLTLKVRGLSSVTGDSSLSAMSSPRTTGNLSLAITQPVAPQSVANDIEYTRNSYVQAIENRSSALEEEEKKYGKSRQINLILKRSGYNTGEKRYSTIFPKTAPVKYNKSALTDADLGIATDRKEEGEEDEDLRAISKHSYLFIKKKHVKEHIIEQKRMSISSSKGKMKRSSKFRFTDSFIDRNRSSQDYDDETESAITSITSEESRKLRCSTKQESQRTNKEITWDEVADGTDFSTIDGGDESLETILDLTKEPEVNVSEASSSSRQLQEGEFRYVRIPREKIENFLTRGIKIKQSIVADQNTVERLISVKRKAN